MVHDESENALLEREVVVPPHGSYRLRRLDGERLERHVDLVLGGHEAEPADALAVLAEGGMMAVETTITLICDRCGSRHDKASYMAGNSWGQLNLTWQGNKGGRAWDGSAGGVELKGKALLCEPCTDAFLDFIKPEVGNG